MTSKSPAIFTPIAEVLVGFLRGHIVRVENSITHQPLANLPADYLREQGMRYRLTLLVTNLSANYCV